MLICFFGLLTTSVFGETKSTGQKREQIATIAAVGDILVGTDFPYERLPKDEEHLFSEARRTLASADIVFGNLESPLCDGGYPAKKLVKGRTYLFRTPTRFAGTLKNAGFNVLSIANNHAFDFGSYGLESTKRALSRVGIKYLSNQGEVAEFDIHEIKVGIVAFSATPSRRSIVHPELALQEIKVLAAKYNILIVSVHGGKEGKDALHVKDEAEYFLDEPRGNLVQFAHAAIDMGADLIIMHGPHVPRATEIYKDRFIAYSLGNFRMYGSVGTTRVAPLLWIELNERGKPLRIKIFSFIQNSQGIPIIDSQKNALDLLNRLSKEDFPKSTPVLEDGFK